MPSWLTRRLAENLAVERAANEAYEHHRATTLTSDGRRFGARPNPYRGSRGDPGGRSGSAFVAAHELGGFEHVAGERSLELAPPGTQADGEPGV